MSCRRLTFQSPYGILTLWFLDVVGFSVYLHSFATLATVAFRPAVSLAFVTRTTSKHIVEPFRTPTQRLGDDVVDGSVSTVLQLFATVMAELLLSLWEVSSTLMSVWHEVSLQHLPQQEPLLLHRDTHTDNEAHRSMS